MHKTLRPVLSVLAVGILLTGCASAVIGGGGEPRYRGADSATADYADARTAAAVRGALYRDPVLAGHDIRVQVSAGVVTLTGSLPDERLARRAVSLVRGVPGVVRVNSQLQSD